MDQPRQMSPSEPAGRTVTERRAAEELGLDRLELYLAAAAKKLGRYDPMTHVLVFSDAEVEQLAAELGVSRRRRREPSPADIARIPEPNGE